MALHYIVIVMWKSTENKVIIISKVIMIIRHGINLLGLELSNWVVLEWVYGMHMGVWRAYVFRVDVYWWWGHCWSQVERLKVVSQNCSRRYCSNLGMFSSVPANGKLLGCCGRPGDALVLQWVLADGIVGGLDVEGDLKMQLLGLMTGFPLVRGTVVVICSCQDILFCWNKSV